MILNNAHKYSVSAMCEVLKLAKSTYYYKSKKTLKDNSLIEIITKIFRASQNNYGRRKIKIELTKK